MEEGEFCRRFVAEIVRATVHRSAEDREYLKSYAVEVAPSYHADPMGMDTPEDCAQTDMSYWE